jgi:hypothetical protein
MTDRRQSRPLVREGARIGQDCSCQTVNKHLVMSPRQCSTSRHTDWPTISRKVTLTPGNSRNGSSNLYSSLNGTSDLQKKPQWTGSIGFFSARPRRLLPSTIEGCPLFIAATRPVEQCRTGSAPGYLPREDCSATTFCPKAALFRANTNSGCWTRQCGDQHYSASERYSTMTSIQCKCIPKYWCKWSV